MFGSVRKSAGSFGRNERGGVAIMFGLTAIGMIGFIGLAVDGSRAFGAKTKAVAALDAAALAATRAIIEGESDEEAVNEIAHRVFLSNVENTGSLNADYPDFDTDIDFDSKTVRASVIAHTPTLLGGMFGVDQIAVPTSATATFNVRDIELGMQLDLTGSMCRPRESSCTSAPKLDALKVATADLVDTLMPEGHLNRVRIGLAPFSAGVNAGDYVNDVAALGAPDGCVYDRASGDAASDDLPADGLYKSKQDLPPPPRLRPYTCPDDSATLVPLTDDSELLKATVAEYGARGSTAGHLGSSWAWNLISPKWTSIWPADSAPVDYDSANTLKAVVLMTDGMYNTWDGISNNNLNSFEALSSRDAAMSLCRNMKEREIVVYTVFFNDGTMTAREVDRAHEILESCATDNGASGGLNFFEATDGAQLRQAFQDIAFRLTALRLAQ